MKVEKAVVVPFNIKEPKTQFNVRLPKNSVLMDLVALSDGIYLMYLAPTLISSEEAGEVVTFVIGVNTEDINPQKDTFMQTVVVYVPPVDQEGKEVPYGEPNIILFPIFRRNN